MPCAYSCHGRGICDKSTGVCACEAGYNGSFCEEVNVRKCNDRSDGLWVASHCAGECDERRGWCWCPGKIGERPMVEVCQVKHMPLEAFAALELAPDPQARKYDPSTGEEINPMGPGRVRVRDDARKREFQALQHRLWADPSSRAEVTRSFWYGPPKIGRNGRDERPQVVVDKNGVPHTINTSLATGTIIGSEKLLTDKKAGWFQKLSARGTHKYDKLLVAPDVSAPAWCEARLDGPKAAHNCPCVYDGMHGELCEKRHMPYCANQCSGHGTCAEFGAFCNCDPGYFGIDCSMTTELSEDGKERVVLHRDHPARLAPRRPYIYVYDVPDHTSLILQYRAQAHMCTHRAFTTSNQTEFPTVSCAQGHTHSFP